MMRWIALGALLAGQDSATTPRHYLFLGQNEERDTVRVALAFWERLPGPKSLHLVTRDLGALEKDLLRWADLLPRGAELAPWDPEVPALLRKFDVRRLPCFVAVDRRVHRVYGVPRKEVIPCRR
jgi:hypothetical protein